MLIELTDEGLVLNSEIPYVLITKEAFEWLIETMKEQSAKIEILERKGQSGDD